MHYQRLLFFKITTLNFLLRQWKGWHVLAALLVLGTIPYFSDGNDRDLRKSYTSVRISHWKYLVFDFNFSKPTFITCMKCCCLVFQTKTLGSLWIHCQKLLPCVFFGGEPIQVKGGLSNFYPNYLSNFRFRFVFIFKQKMAPKLSICYLPTKWSVWVFDVTNRTNGFSNFQSYHEWVMYPFNSLAKSCTLFWKYS